MDFSAKVQVIVHKTESVNLYIATKKTNFTG